MEVRLNSPHGKFKRTEMADNQVDLTPEVDIPRTNFIEKEIDKFTIAQLILMLIFILISIIICISIKMVIRRIIGKVGVSSNFVRSISCFKCYLFSTTS